MLMVRDLGQCVDGYVHVYQRERLNLYCSTVVTVGLEYGVCKIKLIRLRCWFGMWRV